LPEVGLGILPGGGGSQRLPRLLGRARALEVIVGAEDLDAELAERYGWINRALAAAGGQTPEGERDIDALLRHLRQRRS
jgi:enoyl-CoA hydratase/carnithine racemase